MRQRINRENNTLPPVRDSSDIFSSIEKNTTHLLLRIAVESNTG